MKKLRGFGLLLLLAAVLLGAVGGTVEASGVEMAAPGQMQAEEQMIYASADEGTMYDVFLADYWRTNKTFEQLMWSKAYQNGQATMPYRSTVDGLEANFTFSWALAQWEATMFVFGDSGDVIEKQDMYDRVVYQIVYSYYEDKLCTDYAQVDDQIDNFYADLIQYLGEYTEEKYGKSLSEFIGDVVDDVEFTKESLESSVDMVEFAGKLAKLDAFEGLGVSKIIGFLDMCSTMGDFLEKTAVVMYLNNTSGEIADILVKAANYADNENMQQSLKNIAACCTTDNMWEMYHSIYSGSTGVGFLFSTAIEGVKAGIALGCPAYAAGVITANVTDSMLDSCFSHNEMIETFYYMRALCEFETAMKKTCIALNSDYSNARGTGQKETMRNAAKKYCQSVYLLNCTLELGLTTAEDFYRTAAGDDSLAEKYLYPIFGVGNYTKEQYQELVSSTTAIRNKVLQLVAESKLVATEQYESWLKELVGELSSSDKSYESLDEFCEFDPTEVVYNGDKEQDAAEVEEYLNYYRNISISEHFTLEQDLDIFGNLIIKDGGYLILNSHTVDVGSNVIVDVDGTVTVGLKLYGGTLNVGGDVFLEEGWLELAGGILNVEGNLYAGEKGEIDPETGYRLATSAGHLMMDRPQDRVNVAGDFVSCTSESHHLYDGVLTIGGDFYQYGNVGYDPKYAYYGSYSAQYNHRTVFTDDVNHSIYFENPAENRFQQVDFGNGEIEFLSALPGLALYEDAEWNLKLPDLDIEGWLNLNGYKLTLLKSINITDGKIWVNDGTLDVKGDLVFGKPGEIEEETGYRLAASHGYLDMTYGGDRVNVAGDFISCTSEAHYLGDGVLTIGGDFYQYGTSGYNPKYAYYDSFSAQGSHRTVFTKDVNHSIYFESPDKSGFGQVNFGNGEIELLSPLKGFGLYEDAEWNLKLPDLAIEGTLNLNGHKLTFLKSINITDGEIYLYNGALDVKGDLAFGRPGETDEETGYRLATSHGELDMTFSGDVVNVAGDFVSCTTEGHKLSGGFLTIGGDFAQYGSSGYDLKYAYYGTFSARDGHHTVFTENVDHSIYFESPDQSGFGQVDFSNGEIELLSPLKGFALYADVEWNLKLAEDKFAIVGTLDLGGNTLTIQNDLNVTAGEIKLSEGKLVVNGDLSFGTKGEIDEETGYRLATSSGELIMEYVNDEVIVEGDFTICSSESSTLNAGTLYVRGDFAQYGTSGYDLRYAYYGSFAPSSGYSHTSVLDGAGPQSIYFESEYCGFNVLRCVNPRSYYTFNPDECWNTLDDWGVPLLTVVEPSEAAGTVTDTEVKVTVSVDEKAHVGIVWVTNLEAGPYDAGYLRNFVKSEHWQNPEADEQITFTISDLTPETTYGYFIVAYDDSDNYGAFGEIVVDETGRYTYYTPKLVTTAKRGEDESGGEEPGGDEPGGENPGGENPGGDEPGGEEPGGDEPGESTPEERVADFVERMYTVALGREAESEGAAWWTAELLAGASDGAGLAQGFLTGTEFQNKGYSNDEFVGVLYDTFFNREVAEGEGDFWVGALDAGESRESVLAGFVNSTEFFNLCAEYGIARGTMKSDGIAFNAGIGQFAERLYTEVLGRAGEEEGMEYWGTSIANGECTPKDAAMNFFTSSEYVAKNTSNEEYLEALYRTFMGRASDEAGMNFWLGSMEAGSDNRTSALESFAASEEFQKIMASYGL